MNPELVADDSDLLGFPEVVGPFVAGRFRCSSPARHASG